MTTRRLTIALLLIAVALLVIYDVIIKLEPTPNDTISAVIWSFSAAHPFVPAAIGTVCGHWFWPPRSNVPAFGAYVLLGLGVVVAGLDWIGLLTAVPSSVSFALGFGAGAWLWGPED